MIKIWYLTAAVILAGFLAAPAEAQSPKRVEAEKLFVRAQKSLSVGDDARAEDLLKRSLQMDAGFTSAIWQLSQIYEKRGSLEHARELLLRGLQREPNASWAREKLKRLEKILIQKLLSEAEELMNRGDYVSALPKLSLFHGIRPYDPEPLIRMGRCHLAMDNPETAKEYFVQAYERDPSNKETASLLAEVNQRIDSKSIAAAVADARAILADYSGKSGRKAKDALEAVLLKDPENKWAREKIIELDLMVAQNEKESPQKTLDSPGENTSASPSDESPGVKSIAGTLKYVASAVAAALLLFFALRLGRSRSSRRYPLQGSVTLIPLLDIVSLINANLKTGRLEIKGESNRGEIYFDKGEIIHARYKAEDGKSAFQKLISIGSGRYTFINHLPKVRQTVSEPLSLLLLSVRTGEGKPAKPDSQARTRKVTV